MTAFNFPNVPYYNEVYRDYTWDGEKWYLTVGGVGATGLFSPIGLQNLIGWWDTSLTASLTLTGSSIDAIADRSPTGSNLTWSGSKPTYNATGFNFSTKPAMEFTGSGASLINSAFPIGTGNALTVWLVGTFMNPTGGVNYGRPLSYVKPAAGNDADNAGSFCLNTVGTSTSAMRFTRSAADLGITGTAYPAPQRMIFTVASSGVIVPYLNGVASAGATIGGNWVSAGTLALGRSAQGGNAWSGAIAEAGIAAGFTNATTVALLDTYLKTKWGLNQAGDFLARTSGLDTTHINAYTALIDGLVADGVWNKLDVLRIYATQDSTTALLNLVSSNFTGVTHGSPTFTADRGFTGVDTSGSVYISNGFNGTTAVSPKYVQDSAHISSWAANNVACQPPAGYANTGLSFSAYYFKYSDGNIYNRVNGTGSSDNCGTIAYNGHIICQRNGSTAGQVYRNGTSAYSGALVTSRPVQNMDFYELGDNINNSPYGSGNQYSMVSWGAALTSGEALAFYNRLRTYMTAVGVP